MAHNELVQSLLRGLDILHLLGDAEGGMRLTDLAELLGVKPPTAHNLLRTLVDRRFVEQDGGRYRLGPALGELAAAEADRLLLRLASVTVMDLGRRMPTGTVTLAELLAGEVAVRLRVSPDRPGVLQRLRGRTLPPYATASGLLVQAHAAGDVLSALRARHPFWEQGSGVWKSPKDLERYLLRVRDEGYAELPVGTEEATRVAAPVFGMGAEFVATLGLNLPGHAVGRKQAKQRAGAIAAVVAAAAELSASLAAACAGASSGVKGDTRC
jgi:DNA-binding IclR family transcriptional regulator